MSLNLSDMESETKLLPGTLITEEWTTKEELAPLVHMLKMQVRGSNLISIHMAELYIVKIHRIRLNCYAQRSGVFCVLVVREQKGWRQ